MNTRTDPIFRDTTPTNSVNLGITTKCSMSCPKCSIDVPALANAKQARHVSIHDIWRDSRHMKGLRRVHVTGGEPTIHPMFYLIISHIREWFEPQYVTLETNGAKVVKCLDVIDKYFDKVFITHYERDAIYLGSPDNTHIIEQAEKRLKDRLIREAPVRHVEAHERIKSDGLVQIGLRITPPAQEKPCTKFFDPGLPSGWYDGKIYACCVSFGIDERLGVRVDEHWRERVVAMSKGCDQCCFRGT